MTVYLALSLVESLVKNCGDRVYAAVNEVGFMRSMGKCVRRYHELAVKGNEYRKVADLSADIVQVWGEAFLSKSKIYPNISRTYHELRKEGIPFKAQCDESRYPIFSSNASSEVHHSVPFAAPVEYEYDPQLEAAVRESLSTSRNQQQSNRRISQSLYQHSDSNSSSNNHKPNYSKELIDLVQGTTKMLKEIICASTSRQELADNDAAEEVAEQLKSSLKQLEVTIPEELERRPEVLMRMSPGYAIIFLAGRRLFEQQ